MVLLKGLNDDTKTLEELHLWLLQNRCRPYRLYHCDYTEGVSHFRVPLQQGLELIQQMRGYSSGLAIPEYVIDLPNGYGKVPVIEGRPLANKQWEFQSWNNQTVVITE